MILYQTSVTFYVKQALIKVSGAPEIPLKVENKLFLSINQDRLVFYTSDQTQLCSTNLSPCYFTLISLNQCHLTHIKPNQGKTPGNIDPIIVLSLKSTSECINQIKNHCSSMKHRDCLSFSPIQSQQSSILSGQSVSPKFRGFINLMVLMLIALNLRNMYDNFTLYGLKFLNYPFQMLPLACFIGIGLELIFVQVGYRLDLLRFQGILSNKTVRFMLILNQSSLVIFNWLFCRKFLPNNPVSATVVTFACLILLLKLISYMQVNTEIFLLLRKSASLSNDQFNQYVFASHQINGQNLKIILENRTDWLPLLSRKRLGYFLLAPTLCYQLSYPRSSKIRVFWLMKKIVALLFVVSLQIVICLQYIEPELQAWFSVSQKQQSFFEMANRLIRLAIPTMIQWIIFFYAVFQLYLVIVAQLFRFGDRKFYLDWWNCHNLEEYWRTWNLPVHHFFVRHFYNPLTKMGLSRYYTNLLIFTISAIAHEYLVDVPLGVVGYWSFLAIFLQHPAIELEKYISKTFNLQSKNSQLGNISFWLSFCFIGQPACLFIYYSMYMKTSSMIQ